MNLIYLIVIELIRLSILYWVCCDSFYFPRNLSISSVLSNLSLFILCPYYLFDICRLGILSFFSLSDMLEVCQFH